ncbi:MAG TPA: hypothetical protein VNO70_17130 [Blastocatellia bacterium]|nr:hypothetical protein [Blastocatellia bacterium]
MDDLERNIESLLARQARAWAALAWLKTGFLRPGATRPVIPPMDWQTIRERLNKLLAGGEVTRDLTEQIDSLVVNHHKRLGDLESRLP